MTNGQPSVGPFLLRDEPTGNRENRATFLVLLHFPSLKVSQMG